MTKRTLAILGAFTAALFGPAAVAADAPAAAPAIVNGPPIPGVCMLSFNQAIGQSTVGGNIKTRLDQILAQVRAELAPEESSLDADWKALDGVKATLDQATLQSRAQALQARTTALQQKADLRQREMKATQDKALNRVAQELEPIARSLYESHRCSLLLDKTAVMQGNPAMDLTPEAVTALNAKITDFPFDREHLDTGVPAGN
jgi:outer membrane protein